MNYQKIYDDICKRGQERILPKEVYTEKHHIVPKCLGGGNEKSNLTVLTAKEHFLVHYILAEKLYPENRKLLFAFWRMCVPCRKYQFRYIPNSRLYKYVRSIFIESVSGENSLRFGKPLSEQTRQRISESNIGRIVSEETRERISEKNKGRVRTSIWIQRLKNSKQNISTETRQRMSNAQKGKVRSNEFKENLRILMSGEGNHNFGKKFSDEYRKKLSDNSGRRRAVVVGNFIFKQGIDSAAFFGLTQGQISYRFSSKSPKWEDWNYLDQIILDENCNYTDLREQSFS